MTAHPPILEQSALISPDGLYRYELTRRWAPGPLARAQAIHLTDQAGRTLFCVGRTKAGAPRHPLYVRGDAPLIPLDRHQHT